MIMEVARCFRPVQLQLRASCSSVKVCKRCRFLLPKVLHLPQFSPAPSTSSTVPSWVSSCALSSSPFLRHESSSVSSLPWYDRAPIRAVFPHLAAFWSHEEYCSLRDIRLQYGLNASVVATAFESSFRRQSNVVFDGSKGPTQLQHHPHTFSPPPLRLANPRGNGALYISPPCRILSILASILLIHPR